MSERPTPEILFVEHLDWIEKVAAMACHDRKLRGADVEDFTGWVKLKLMADDYAVIRNFGGRSALKTYLATIVVRQSHEYLRERWGRWRPSAVAGRLDPLAAELEVLVHRDGYTLAQASEKLRTAGRTTLSDVELARLFAQLPKRAPGRPVEVSLEGADGEPEGPFGADERITAAEDAALRGTVTTALERAMQRLDAEDQMIVRMHVIDEMTLADVARALDLEQKPLYRRLGRLLERLRTYLEQDGIGKADVHGLLSEREVP
jgi:RNA polymerase sigma factor for flagellar operon FliA